MLEKFLYTRQELVTRVPPRPRTAATLLGLAGRAAAERAHARSLARTGRRGTSRMPIRAARERHSALLPPHFSLSLSLSLLPLPLPLQLPLP